MPEGVIKLLVLVSLLTCNPMVVVNILGQIIGASEFVSEGLFCKWAVVFGNHDWQNIKLPIYLSICARINFLSVEI